jgi:hypothetical protein
MVHKPESGLGYLGGELLYLDPVELIDIHSDQQVNVKAFFLTHKTGDHLKLKQAEFPVTDDEEVPAAAGGVKEGELF